MSTEALDAIFGMRVFASPFVPPPKPKIQLDPAFKFCTPEFRAEINAWFLERFGKEHTVYMVRHSLIDDRPALVMHPDRYRELLRTLTQAPSP